MTEGAFLAALTRGELPNQAAPLSKTPFMWLKDSFLIVLLAVALMLLLMVWAKYLRGWKPKKRHSEGHKVYRDGQNSSGTPEVEDEEESLEDEPPNVRRRYKYRYKRRSHRSRNPTLAETGGLPPARPGEPSEQA